MLGTCKYKYHAEETRQMAHMFLHDALRVTQHNEI